MSVKKKLVFHFYADIGWDENIANVCHFSCLEHFSNVFDEAVVVVSDGGIGKDGLLKVKGKFTEIFNDIPLTLKTAPKTPYFEADTFYSEIVSKSGESGGIVFFAHNKGVSNVKDKNKSKTAILSWICGLYFYGLSHIEEVEYELSANKRTIFYGPYLMTADYISNKNKLWYAGTFYWVNSGRLARTVESIPPISDREYAEWLPGEVGNTVFLKSHSGVLNDTDLYHNWMYAAKKSARSVEEYQEFLTFREKIMGWFKEYQYTILTCNFGKYEIMREIWHKQDDVEYVYLTDDEKLTSDTWKITYDHDLDGLTPIQKLQKVRENPFKYCSTTTCVRIDASIEVTGSLDKLIRDFHEANSDIGIMVHPERDNVFDEYDKWEEFRALDPKEKPFVTEALSRMGCDLTIKGLYETGFMVYVKNEYTDILLRKYAEIMNNLVSEFGVVRVDQVVFSSVMNSFGNVYVFPMSHQCIQSKELRSMEHNSCFTCIVKDIPENGYIKNEFMKLYTIDNE